MKTSVTIVRITLGLLIAFSGANKFGEWLNIAYMHDSMAFVLDLASIGGGFLIKAMGIVEVIIGISLIANKFASLSSLALFPLIVGILVFHFLFDLKGIGVAVFVFVLNAYLIYVNKENVLKIIRVENPN